MRHVSAEQSILGTTEQGHRRRVEVEGRQTALPSHAVLEFALGHRPRPEIHETCARVRDGLIGGQVRIIARTVVLAVPAQAIERSTALPIATLHAEHQRTGVATTNGIGKADVRLCIAETGRTRAIAEDVHAHTEVASAAQPPSEQRQVVAEGIGPEGRPHAPPLFTVDQRRPLIAIDIPRVGRIDHQWCVEELTEMNVLCKAS